ncbi:hypothetical protein D8B26_004428 [Coccidioides posadasii str. Silveira]|uniref:uncharacterized protein n=1 Tax=Coccidioides posadasii (strain RMSCC 757 / Silveira) TaxID=443226 RepID=UPI001BF1718D|nr:hypothetical protein D8B26_004428 [Coccidioides posadasii str. Silveira]
MEEHRQSHFSLLFNSPNPPSSLSPSLFFFFFFFSCLRQLQSFSFRTSLRDWLVESQEPRGLFLGSGSVLLQSQPGKPQAIVRATTRQDPFLRAISFLGGFSKQQACQSFP